MAPDRLASGSRRASDRGLFGDLGFEKAPKGQPGLPLDLLEKVLCRVSRMPQLEANLAAAYVSLGSVSEDF